MKKKSGFKEETFFFNLGNEKLYFEVERKEHTVFLGQGGETKGGELEIETGSLRVPGIGGTPSEIRKEEGYV